MADTSTNTSADEEVTKDTDAELDLLDKKVESMVVQVEMARKTREEILEVTRKLKEALKVCEESPGLAKESQQKLIAISSEVAKREEVLDALEQREMLLSLSLLNTINSWAKEETGDTVMDLEYAQNEVEESGTAEALPLPNTINSWKETTENSAKDSVHGQDVAEESGPAVTQGI